MERKQRNKKVFIKKRSSNDKKEKKEDTTKTVLSNKRKNEEIEEAKPIETQSNTKKLKVNEVRIEITRLESNIFVIFRRVKISQKRERRKSF